MTEVVDPSSSATPIGIAIARRRQQEQQQKVQADWNEPGGTKDDQEQVARKKRRKKRRDSAKEDYKPQLNKPSYQKPVSSFQLFVATSLLYGACVWLPSGIAFLLSQVKLFYEHFEQRKQLGINDTAAATWFPDVSFVSESTAYATDMMCRSYPVGAFLDYVTARPQQSSSMAASTAVSVISYFCPEQTAEQPLLSQDASFSDFQVIVTLSLFLALIRLAVTLLLVPRKGREQIKALVRCKSVHLLSREYPLTPTQSIRSIVETVDEDNDNLPLLPDVGGETQARASSTDGFVVVVGNVNDQESIGFLDDSSSSDGAAKMEISEPQQVSSADDATPALPTDNFVEIVRSDSAMPRGEPLHASAQDQRSSPDEQPDAPNSGHADASAEAAEQSPAIEPKDSEGSEHNEEEIVEEGEMEVMEYVAAATAAIQNVQQKHHSAAPAPEQRLYAAPRMATALFRFLHSITTAFVAFWWFHSRAFWPSYVGGSGSTQACWDLSGTTFLMAGMERSSEQNLLLKRYFLWQASYHWHAGAFHIFSFLLLLFTSSSRREKQPMLSERNAKRSASLARKSSFAETAAKSFFFSTNKCSLVLIGTGYVFSSVRQLGAIGMFAFDVSSVFLHALQLCMNLPQFRQESPLHGKKSLFVRCLLYACVLPSFLLCRFGICIALWWSAWTESAKLVAAIGTNIVSRSVVVAAMSVALLHAGCRGSERCLHSASLEPPTPQTNSDTKGCAKAKKD